MENLIHNLREELLKITLKKANKELFDSLAESIIKTSKCFMYSLWTINNNSTQGERVFKSISILSRELKKGDYKYKDFVLELEGTFIEKTINDTKPYHICADRSEHKSQKCLEEYDLNYFIGIPILDFENPETIIAVLNLSYTKDPEIIDLKSFSSIIRDVISSCMYRHKLHNMKHLMEELVRNYQNFGSKKNIGDIFFPVLKEILPKYIGAGYEGTSFFMWNSYRNYYELLSTTGIKEKQLIFGKEVEIPVEKNDYYRVFYHSDNGFTGRAAKEKKSKIYDDLTKENNNPVRNGKFFEVTNGKTMMVVPVFRPSTQDEVIGILRFVNKKNRGSNKEIDYFNDGDKEIIEFAAQYLSLIIDYFLCEEERNSFVSKLSHEFKDPARFIRDSADRLLKGKGNFFSYLRDIRDISQLQLQQAEMNLYVFKSRIKKPRAEKYKPEPLLLKNIINRGKDIIKPFARIERVTFDNIKIDVNFPDWELFVDKDAFTTVFFNLLTNAIKFHRYKSDIIVNITGIEVGNCLIVNVSDYGLGISETDSEKIFSMGFRGDNVIKYNTDGFGIGLPVVKQIIEDFDGEICVSNFHCPTTFEIKLHKKLTNDNYTKEPVWNSVK